MNTWSDVAETDRPAALRFLGLVDGRLDGGRVKIADGQSKCRKSDL
jgi:hypothetical protein